MVTQTAHFGPHVDSVGGTQSVIRTIRDHSIGSERVHVFPTWDGPNQIRNAVLTAAAARWILRSGPRTVLHFHVSRGGGWIREGTLIRLARRRGLRTVGTLHGDQVPSFVEAHPELAGSILPYLDRITCLSESAREAVSEVARGTPVEVLPNPVEVDWDSPRADLTPPQVLFAGAIGLRKGVDVLAAAWRQILARDFAAECRVVGPSDDFTPPKLDRFVVEGPVSPTEVPDLIRGCRVVVLPSRSEGMPMILAEALAARRPVVATDVGGVRDITVDDSMIVPAGDADALARALTRFLADPALAASAGERGQRHIIQTRSPKVIDKRLRAIYSSI